MKCDVCGKDELLPYRCKYCGGVFCVEHRLPEEHDCDAIDDYWNVPVNVKKEKKKFDAGSFPIRPGKSARARSVKLPDFRLASYGYNNIILALITLMFFVGIFSRGWIIQYLALNPARFATMPWQIVTAMFVHLEFWHYFINAFILLIFGGELERRVGSKKYLEIFLLSGISGNVFYILFAYVTGDLSPAIGASGAIYGVMGTLAIIAPEIRVLLLFFIPMSIRTAILLFAAYDLLMLPMSRVTGVASIAHLGGLLVGLYYGRKMKVIGKTSWWR